MSLKDSPINLVVIFKDSPGIKKYFAGNKFEKENCNIMVYNLRAMIFKWGLKTIKEAQIFDNRIMRSDDRMIFHMIENNSYDSGFAIQRNDLENYLGKDYNPKPLK